MRLATKERETILTRLSTEAFDLLIIGGGITGAGAALDASKRGLKVALLEMQDFAEGTSSRSTKLVHGGLRYLKNFQIGVVRTTGRERAIVYENGPHVTTPEKMLLPLHKGGTFGRFSTSIGLALYDHLAQVKRGERRKMLSREEVLKRAPLIKEEGLKGGGYYVEYRTDDARLTMEVHKKAVTHGALILNYLKAEGFTYGDDGLINGVIAKDQLTQREILVRAKIVVNATGPWVESIRDQVEHPNDKHLLLTKGVHLVIDKGDFPLDQAVYFDTKSDGRMIFAVPRGRKVYVGTTDTKYEGSKTHPVVTAEDRAYLLSAINYMFPQAKISEAMIESSWAGIRPLILEEGKDPSEISRKDEIWEDPSGLVTIAGGKLTGYRHMAEEIIDRVAMRLLERYQIESAPCDTIDEPISGGEVGGSRGFQSYIEALVEEADRYHLSEQDARTLVQFYGSNAPILFEIAKSAKEGEEPALKILPLLLFTRLKYALEEELTVTPADFFIRRTGMLFFNIAEVEQYKEGVIQYMGDYFGWSDLRRQQYAADLDRALFEAKNGVEQSQAVSQEQLHAHLEESSLGENGAENQNNLQTDKEEEKMSDTFKKVGEKIKDGAHAVSEKAQELGGKIADEAKELTEKTKDKIEEAKLKERAHDFVEGVKEKAHDLKENVEEKWDEHKVRKAEEELRKEEKEADKLFEERD